MLEGFVFNLPLTMTESKQRRTSSEVIKTMKAPPRPNRKVFLRATPNPARAVACSNGGSVSIALEACRRRKIICRYHCSTASTHCIVVEPVVEFASKRGLVHCTGQSNAKDLSETPPHKDKSRRCCDLAACHLSPDSRRKLTLDSIQHSDCTFSIRMNWGTMTYSRSGSVDRQTQRP